MDLVVNCLTLVLWVTVEYKNKTRTILQRYSAMVCVCVRVCVRARVRACARWKDGSQCCMMGKGRTSWCSLVWCVWVVRDADER